MEVRTSMKKTKKISDLVKLLKDAQNTFGDLEVCLEVDGHGFTEITVSVDPDVNVLYVGGE